MTAPAALTERARRLFEEIRELEPADSISLFLDLAVVIL